MAKLIIKRTSEWNNSMRNFGIYLDHKKIGLIKNGKTNAFKLEPGRHTISSKIDWFRSRTMSFKINKNETKTVELSGFRYSTFIFPLLLIILLIYVIAKTQFNTDLGFLLILGIVIFCYPLYYLTFGKNGYLRIKELK